jgi:hypothetical protein
MLVEIRPVRGASRGLEVFAGEPAVLDISLERDVTKGTIPPPPLPDRLLFTLSGAERSPSRGKSAGRPAGAIRALVHACE